MLTQSEQKIKNKYPFLYNEILQSKIKCFSKIENPAIFACCQQKCTNNPFMCQKGSTCECYHPNCKNIKKLNELINKLKQKANNAQKKVQQSNKLFDDMIQELNKNYFIYTKQSIQKTMILNLFSVQQTDLIQNLSNSKYHNKIHPSSFYNLDQSKKVPESFQNTIREKLESLTAMVKLQVNNIEKYCQSYITFYGTKVIPKEPQEILKLKNLLKPLSISRTALLYRASENEFQLDKFHQKCNNIKDTLLLVKTKQGAIIGAYTPLLWNYPKGNVSFVEDISKKTFIFSLKDQIKLVQKDQKVGIRNSNDYAPQFGTLNTYDFGICQNANNSRSSFIYFRGNFVDSNKIYLSDKEDNWNNFFKSKSNRRDFLIQQWEVWQLTFQ